MNILINILLILLAITLIVFVHDFLYPYLRSKWFYYKSIRTIKNMSKKASNERVKKVLGEVADYMKKANKDTKLGDE